jgi:hypothetical protein
MVEQVPRVARGRNEVLSTKYQELAAMVSIVALGTCHLLLVTSSAAGAGPLSRFIFAMKFSRSGARKVRTKTREPPEADVRTLHSRDRREKSLKSQGPSIKKAPKARCLLVLVTWYLVLLARSHPPLRLRRVPPTGSPMGEGLSCITAAQLWPICTAFPAVRKFRWKERATEPSV